MAKKRARTRSQNTGTGARYTPNLIDLRGEKVALITTVSAFVAILFMFIGMFGTIQYLNDFLKDYHYGFTLFVSVWFFPLGWWIGYLVTRIDLVNRINLLKERFEFVKEARDDAFGVLVKLSGITKITSKERGQMQKVLSKAYESGRKEGVKATENPEKIELPSSAEIFANNDYGRLDAENYSGKKEDKSWMG